MELDARVTLSGGLRSPAEARRFVARTLTPLLGREDVETAVLVTSELVTNAALSASASCALHLRGTHNLLHIRVTDVDNRVPARRRAGTDDLATGRGLRLLEVLCRRWGVDRDHSGDTVWCDLSVRG